MTQPINVLFLCTGNSARSLLAEALLNDMGRGQIHACSAGSHPKGDPHPMALEVLRSQGLPVGQLRSKSWTEFAGPEAPRFDIILTVCDNAAGESCPVWPGRPITAHWGIEDPAAVEGEDQRSAFEAALKYLRKRISNLVELPLKNLDEKSLRAALREIGSEDGASQRARGQPADG